MTNTPVQEYDAISKTLRIYHDAAKSGDVEAIRAAFHPDATICGYVGPDLFAGPIEKFYEWHRSNGPAEAVEIRNTSVDIAGSIATARLEIDNWTGHRFTDQITLLKCDGEWKIVSKVFHLHES